ncbi:Chaperone protein dnaJ [Zostera marina]|uniref:Chaperone protein dnaJ n=1 Tax=Zostera marina TaxID=29655 RepID=A0A0K9PSZ4_ZOSMR|nr:Chaperone protein dnaJ [Zostera marina]
MGDIGLLKQGWNWLRSQKPGMMGFPIIGICARDKFFFFIDRHWPILYQWCLKLWSFTLMLVLWWRNCVVKGIASFIGLEYMALFVIMWSGFLSLTSTSYVYFVFSVLGASGVGVHYLGYTSGLFIVGLFGILMMWLYGNIWASGMLFIVGGYMFSLNHARPLIFLSIAYSLYCAYVRVGWPGIFHSLNLAFLSNDLLNQFLQGYDHVTEGTHSEEHKHSEPFEKNFPHDNDFFTPTTEAENIFEKKSCKVPISTNSVNISSSCSCSKVIKTDTSSVDEMKRIMKSLNHYEALGISQNESLNQSILRREYRRKAVLVHPDKNMGIELADESFKKLQCAYEVLSDFSKKKDYDDKLKSEEVKSVYQRTYDASQQSGSGYWSEESRRIECTKCGNSHLWICTTRSKANARWCQDCHKHHPAKDGDGWVEYESSSISPTTPKVEIPCAFVCAESKIFDVSEWAVCQFHSMDCRPNTHHPSFHVRMVALDKTAQRSSSSKFHWDLDVEMTLSEDEDEFELWFQQAIASGFFSETTKRRKSSWSPFKMNQKISMKSWRRSS